jgi:hypothetical protein
MNRSPLALLALLPLAASAAQWAKLPAPAGTAAAFIDKSSIVKSGPSYKAWTMQAPSAPQATPDGKQYRSVKQLQLYSCDDRTATLVMEVFYDDAQGKGAIVQSIKYEKFTPDDVVPDSVADAALGVICKKPGS